MLGKIFDYLESTGLEYKNCSMVATEGEQKFVKHFDLSL
jgi:hypothetical protein